MLHDWFSDPHHYFNKDMHSSDCFMMIPPTDWET